MLHFELTTYWVVHKLPQIYAANHATFPIQKFRSPIYLWYRSSRYRGVSVHCALYKMLKIMLCSFLQNKYNKTETGRQSVSVPVSVPVPVPLVTTFLMYKPKYDEKFFSYFKIFFIQYTPQSLRQRPIESKSREKIF